MADQALSVEPLWTLRRAAAFLECRPRRFAKTVESGRIPNVRVGRRSLRFIPADIRALRADPYIMQDLVLAGVYFVRSMPSGPVKIGTSNHIPSRLRALRLSSPAPLKLLGSVRGGTTEEAGLHRRFSGARLHGEWFTATPELLEFIAKEARQP